MGQAKSAMIIAGKLLTDFQSTGRRCGTGHFGGREFEFRVVGKGWQLSMTHADLPFVFRMDLLPSHSGFDPALEHYKFGGAPDDLVAKLIDEGTRSRILRLAPRSFVIAPEELAIEKIYLHYFAEERDIRAALELCVDLSGRLQSCFPARDSGENAEVSTDDFENIRMNAEIANSALLGSLHHMLFTPPSCRACWRYSLSCAPALQIREYSKFGPMADAPKS